MGKPRPTVKKPLSLPTTMADYLRQLANAASAGYASGLQDRRRDVRRLIRAELHAWMNR